MHNYQNQILDKYHIRSSENIQGNSFRILIRNNNNNNNNKIEINCNKQIKIKDVNNVQ